MKRFKGPRGTFVLFLCVIIILLGYYLVTLKGKQNNEEEVVFTKVQNVLLRDLERSYPPTPKEVVIYFSELTQCLHNEEYSEEELEQMAKQIQGLYDGELVANKDEEAYMTDLRSEVTVFKASNSAISSFTPSSSTDVFYFTEEDRECARLYCTYNIRTGTVMQKSEHVFVLRKDEEGHWKILGWDLVDDEAAGE